MDAKACGIGLLGLLVVLAAFVAGCSKDKETAPAIEPKIAQEFCPVMGEPIDKNIYVDHAGQRIYFCCQMCVDTFKKDPERYLNKLDVQFQTGPETEGSHSH